MGMKGGISVNGLRGKWLSLVLTTLTFTTILILAWEKAPLVTILPPQNRLKVLSPGLFHMSYINMVVDFNGHMNFSYLFLYFWIFMCGAVIFNGSLSNNLAALKHKTNNGEDFSYAAIEKETKIEHDEIETELLHSTEVETGSDQGKDSGDASIDSGTARFPDEKKVDDDLTTPLTVEKGLVFCMCLIPTVVFFKLLVCFICVHMHVLAHLHFAK